MLRDLPDRSNNEEIKVFPPLKLPDAGMNKMVINHLDKLIVTSDASTVVNELEVEHPAAKLLALAAKAQEQEIGDGTNLVSVSSADVLCTGLKTLDFLFGTHGSFLSTCRCCLLEENCCQTQKALFAAACIPLRLLTAI